MAEVPLSDAAATEGASEIREIRPVLAPGEVLDGRYLIGRLVGSGGMGQVLAATHLGLDQEVAIKIMLADKAREADSVERFLTEARAAVMLKSSHVARVFDVGTTPGGLPYIVMELLDGKDLVTLLIEGGAFIHGEAVDAVLQACDAVAEAHALGIIHRDLKPENLFLSRRRDGTPHIKVIDFGISKLGVDTTARNGRRVVTQENTVLGSPTYMSPEQVKNSKCVDERSDIWSLGVTLYELLTGAEPFGAETMPEIFVKVLTDAPTPPEQLVPEIPQQLGVIVMRCLEKEPAARFQSVIELATALQPFSSGKPTSMAPSWRGEASQDSSSSLLQRLATTTPAGTPVGPGSLQPQHLSIEAPPSSRRAMSATLDEARPPSNALRRLTIAAALATLVVMVVGGGLVWRTRQRAHVPATVAAPPVEAVAIPIPLPSSTPLPPETVTEASSSSVDPSAPRASASATPRAAVKGGAARPITAAPPRAASPPTTAAPKPSALPRERTSW